MDDARVVHPYHQVDELGVPIGGVSVCWTMIVSGPAAAAFMRSQVRQWSSWWGSSVRGVLAMTTLSSVLVYRLPALATNHVTSRHRLFT